MWSLLLRLLSKGWGGVGGRWMRRATDMSNQRFIPNKKKGEKNTAIAPKHLLLTFQIGLGLNIHLCQLISPPKPSILPFSHSLT